MAELESFHTFLILFLLVLLRLAFTYRVILRLSPGLPRLSFLLPLFPIFILLPWSISCHHIRSVFSFVFLGTLPSKLLHLCFDSPFDFYPLSSGFSYFLASVLLPIRITGPIPKRPVGLSDRTSVPRPLLLQIFALVSVMNLYHYRDRFQPWMIPVFYEIHVYLGLEVVLGSIANLTASSLGVQVGATFNKPFLSASLSEFWGRRWNLVVTSILRSTVYLPTQRLLSRFENQITQAGTAHSESSSDSKDCSKANNVTKIMTSDVNTMASAKHRAIATLTTFLVSGLLHELVFFFITKSPAPGYATGFFIVHGCATATEALARKTFPSAVRLPRAMSIPATLAFLHFTAVWLFFPPITRTGADIRIIAEYHQFQRAFLAKFKTGARCKTRHIC